MLFKRPKRGYDWFKACFFMLRDKRRAATCLILFALLSLFGQSYSAPDPSNPPCMPTVVKRLNAYYEGGPYDEDIHELVEQALSYLAEETKNHHTKSAIVLDVDDTVLSNQAVEKSLRYGFYKPYVFAALQRGELPAIKQMHRLFQYAQDHNITIFFVTGRPTRFRSATEENLRRRGFDHYEAIFFRPENYALKSVVSYKSGARKEITERGYTILLNMGDQPSDLAGGYAEKTIKMPNYMYQIP